MDMEADVTVLRLDDETNINGDETVVVIGANGAGKTTLGVSIAQRNKATRIAAHRNLVLGRASVAPHEADEQIASPEGEPATVSVADLRRL
jgi:ABC-type cobalamin/Fe3+-siderophores transport system ATPase subunit